MNFSRLEREFFRKLNAVVEPAVRRGLGSPRIAPAGLIVLESVGFKTGQVRRTPLAGRAPRGNMCLSARCAVERSFWVRNLQKQPRTRFYRGGSLQRDPGFRGAASARAWQAVTAVAPK